MSMGKFTSFIRPTTESTEFLFTEPVVLCFALWAGLSVSFNGRRNTYLPVGCLLLCDSRDALRLSARIRFQHRTVWPNFHLLDVSRSSPNHD